MQIDLGFTKLCEAIIKSTLEQAVWPETAVYRVVYRLRAWPMGYDDPITRYFNTEEELKQWKHEYATWARSDGNAVSFDIFEWDLGPNLIQSSFY